VLIHNSFWLILHIREWRWVSLEQNTDRQHKRYTMKELPFSSSEWKMPGVCSIVTWVDSCRKGQSGAASTA
jgi:hypothetical protein